MIMLNTSKFTVRPLVTMERMADDDRASFRSVVLPHLDTAYNLAYWLTGNRTDAEDVVQEASLRAFRAIRGFAGISARSWVLKIVRNSAYSWLRKNRPATVFTVEDLEAVEALHAKTGDPDAETPETALIAKSNSEHIRAAIAALPLSFRETLVLRDIEGLDYRDIAAATDVPIGTVMSRLARARGRLLATIGEKPKDRPAPASRRRKSAGTWERVSDHA
jgi:RNA polymerase sigma factor (sigma-70 family)